jgi:tRNA-Thr(GGU) m(6)t(6)A37 methyltransferase TsaA
MLAPRVTVVSYLPIGVIRSPHAAQAGTPIQPAFAGGARGRVVVFDDYREALADLEGFERVWLLYHLDRAKPYAGPRVVPYRDTHERGVFATRVPSRPNPIGLSVVTLVAVEGDELVVEGIDVLDGTPLLDLKPYVPAFDAYPEARAGWFDDAQGGRTTADARFARDDERGRPHRG